MFLPPTDYDAIIPSYVRRTAPPEQWDDTAEDNDKWQREVYVAGSSIAATLGASTIIDFGTGSGFKLVKFFDKRGYYIAGVDLPPTVAWLKKNKPAHKWEATLEEALAGAPKSPHDVRPLFIVCSDVIEHITAPGQLMELFNRVVWSGPKYVLLSTPARDHLELVVAGRMAGPPWNPCHVREWTYWEFRHYCGLYGEVVWHEVVSAVQGTQCLLLRLPTRV